MTAREGGSIRVVATAGHVDHGKSMLIRRLTGMDPDRLEEEKRRGLTIDLGFAWCTLPSGREIGFVDVPGHERFVRTMLAGVGPVRLVLFVVAADEGWKPQSEEHLAIVDVLGVDGAVVALTKRDLVDSERLAAAEQEVRVQLAGTALEGSPVVACSGSSGEGIEELVAAIDEMVGVAPVPAADGAPRLFVDRVFTIAGAGTVVTGTLTGGSLAVGDEVEVLPSGTRGRVRGLQTHKRSLERATPVSRLAVNVAGIERGRLRRGEVLGRRDEWVPTSVVEAEVTPVRGHERPLSARGAYTLHAGAAERQARLKLYGEPRIGRAFARVRLSEPLVLDVFDRFVLRDSGRRATVAGGTVLDPDPPPRPGTAPERRLAARLGASREQLAALLVLERGVVEAAEVRRLANVEALPGAVRVDGRWFASSLHDAVAERVAEALAAFHRSEPAAPGMDVAALLPTIVRELRSARAPADDAIASALVADLVERGAVVREGPHVRAPDHAPSGTDADVDRAIEAVTAGEPTPRSLAELRASGVPAAAIDAAIRSGALVRISPDLVVTRAFVDRAIEVVRAAGSSGITVSDLRRALGTSRKYAVPLAEHLDRVGETRRSGDLRFARGT